MYTRRYQPPVKQKKSRKLIVFGIIFTLLTLIGASRLLNRQTTTSELSQNAEATSQNVLSQNITTSPPYTFSELVFSEEGQSAIGTLEYGVVRTSQEKQPSMPMASITKLVTALVIMDIAPFNKGEVGDTHLLNEQDERYWHDYVALQGTITPVTAGYQMTQYEMLQAILLPSSNNMADSLVDRYFKDRTEYLEYADILLTSYGLKDTRVADASGFSPDSVSTPSDLITIGQKVLQNPVLAEIVAQKNAAISVAGEIPNYNPLIELPGVTGIKPGATDEAGYCLVFSALAQTKSGKSETVIGVVMGHADRSQYQNSAFNLLNNARASIENSP